MEQSDWIDRRYLDDSGAVCPLCSSRNLSAGRVEAHGGRLATGHVKCQACGAEWTDTFTLDTVTGINKGEETPEDAWELAQENRNASTTPSEGDPVRDVLEELLITVDPVTAGEQGEDVSRGRYLDAIELARETLFGPKEEKAVCRACGNLVENGEHEYGENYEGEADAFCHERNQHVHVSFGRVRSPENAEPQTGGHNRENDVSLEDVLDALDHVQGEIKTSRAMLLDACNEGMSPEKLEGEVETVVELLDEAEEHAYELKGTLDGGA